MWRWIGVTCLVSCLANLLFAETKFSHANPHARIYPSAARSPRYLLVFDARGTKGYQERCLIASAQGLANSRPKTRDLVYILWNNDDAFWLREIEHGYVRGTKKLSSIGDIFDLSGRDCLLYDEKPSHLPNIATSVSGCERLLMVGDPQLAAYFELRPRMDLRGKFTQNAQAYRWLQHEYGDRLSREISSITVPYQTATHNPANLRDYLVANKVITYWISGAKEKDMPGADSEAELAALKDFLPKNSPKPVLGYPWSGDGFGPGEWDGVTMISRRGGYLVPTDNFDNLSVWTCFHMSKKKFVSPITHERFDPSKTYAAFCMSDGDNLCTFQQWFRDVWRERKDFSFPVGWTMGPTLNEMAPPIYDYFVRHKPKQIGRASCRDRV